MKNLKMQVWNQNEIAKYKKSRQIKDIVIEYCLNQKSILFKEEIGVWRNWKKYKTLQDAEKALKALNRKSIWKIYNFRIKS